MTPVADPSFWHQLAAAGGGLVFLRRQEQHPPHIAPGGDADVLVNDLDAAAVYLASRGFLRKPTANADQALMCVGGGAGLNSRYGSTCIASRIGPAAGFGVARCTRRGKASPMG